jgi:hypothetical protein
VHVQNNEQIDKGRQDSNIGDIRKPNLIDGSGHQIANQIGKNRIGVIVLSSLHASSSGTAENIVLPHHPKHPRVIGPQALPVKSSGYSLIPISGKLQHDGFYEIPKIRFLGWSIAERTPAVLLFPVVKET